MHKILLLNLAELALGLTTIPLTKVTVDKPMTKLQKIHHEKKRLGGMRFDKTLSNQENEIYVAPIWFGTPL